MAAVGAQVVVDALFVADIDEDFLENACPRAVRHRNGKAALKHVLQQSDGLQADTLSACIRTADDEDVLLAVEHDAERHNLLVLPAQLGFQKGMASLDPVDERRGINLGRNGSDCFREVVFRDEELDVGKELEASQQLLYVGTKLLRKLAKNANHFPLLLGLQFANAVVGFHHFRRLYKDRLARRTLVVNDAFDAAFQGRSDRNHESAVAHGRSNIFLHQTLCLSCFQNIRKRSAHASLGSFQFVPNRQKFAACFVLDATEFVEHLLQTSRNRAESKDAFGKFFEGRVEDDGVAFFVVLSNDFYPSVKGSEHSQKFPNRLLFQIGSFYANAMNLFS